ncbi:DUF3574 domain-containing protein [Desulfosporosinus sp. BICA1-9]|uniref:DUF3574 domain-containing protein n=1 Tax=Desulfosporosinus sp. BICA1-9 TaxID=1531958 RepID=UPI00054BC943|nr:DUF3574 domain-containing protein [Desulfosporosinus sp. BICA1-9]KJS46594.1 MAG: hypothetical protein VR66_24570 [Peptococcaceae bacterium BRH_c23]KJS87358.1 MAG: hypothetical protein JL57_14350 [Desulfosporosinus sp. BICA1-9]HBW39209.1 DUF3574 domain-containing protein [Desulfosporosinus sp.]
MKKRIALILITLLIIFALPGCAEQEKASLADQSEFKYHMYIGLNDKDTYKQIISDDEAQKIVSEICLKYVDGYTVTKRQGVYKDEKGIVTQENSLVYEFYSATDDKIKSVMDEALVKLNQNSILVEKAKVDFKFYEGATEE